MISPLPTPEQFERAGLKAWPGIEVEWDNHWVRRAANGYTKRANSVQCFDPHDDAHTEARIGAAKDWYTSRNLRPVFRTTPLTPPAVEAALDRQDWQSIDLSHQYAMALDLFEPDPQGKLFALLDPTFLDAQQALQNHSPTTMDGMRALLAVMAVPAIGIVVYRDGQPAAAGLMAIADGIVVIGNVITDAARRRQGLASAMMRTGLHWAHLNGATIAALNVQADNAAAKALYAGLGFAHQYDYHYRVPA